VSGGGGGRRSTLSIKGRKAFGGASPARWGKVWGYFASINVALGLA